MDMNNFESVKGKIAIVTGGTSGIGREIAKTFAANGMHVVFSGRNEERGNRIVNDIVAGGGDAMFVKADVRSEEDIRNLIEVTVKKYGKLHVIRIAELLLCYFIRYLVIVLFDPLARCQNEQ